jgi:hypothetical protein
MRERTRARKVEGERIDRNAEGERERERKRVRTKQETVWG